MSHHETDDHLPLFKSPLVHQSTSYDAGSQNSIEEAVQHTKDDGQEPATFEARDESLHDNPQFHRHAEATNAELFYDLFFVANLTVFTSVHEVNDKSTLAQYVGFFCVLWFTWYQVGLYDVRFSMDSLFERIAKALQFGVMVGFAIVGPNFDVGNKVEDGEKGSYSAFKALSLILMVSRLILVCQYVQSLCFTKSYKRTRLPMMAIAITYFVAAIIYLGLFFAFKPKAGKVDHTYITWYIVAILETLIATCVSSVWRVISFKGSHLVQRMSLLTLIILGEGVTGLAKQCQAIVKSKVFEFSASTVTNIASAILILYFLYMLYFDWMSEEHFGTIRQQVWAFLHFPLHLFLVLAVEGQAQSIAWRAATSKNNKILNYINQLTADANVDLTEYVQRLNETATEIINASVSALKNAESLVSINAAQHTIDVGLASLRNSTTSDEQNNAANVIYSTMSTMVYELAGFAPPESKNATESEITTVDQGNETSQENLQKVSNVFALVFIYFFVSVGLVVILNAFTAALSKREKTRIHWIRLGLNWGMGLALALLSVISYTAWYTNNYAYYNYSSSPWILPTVMFTLAILVVMNNFQLPVGRKH